MKSPKPRSWLTGGGRRGKNIERSFSNAGLSRRWWKDFAREFRHCLRCGGGLVWRRVVEESRHRFICKDCRIITYHNPKIVAATLPVWKGKIVLLRRAIEPSLGKWTHPAGYMELGETVEAAAQRESKEEIGCRVELTGVPQLYSYEDAAVVTIVYDAKVVGRGPRPGPESLEVRAFSAADIPWEDLAFRSTFHALRDWAKRVSRGGTKPVKT